MRVDELAGNICLSLPSLASPRGPRRASAGCQGLGASKCLLILCLYVYQTLSYTACLKYTSVAAHTRYILHP